MTRTFVLSMLALTLFAHPVLAKKTRRAESGEKPISQMNLPELRRAQELQTQKQLATQKPKRSEPSGEKTKPAKRIAPNRDVRPKGK